MIKEYELYHGAVFTRLLSQSQQPLQIAGFPNGSSAAYFIRSGEKSAGLFIKHSADRLTPWRFTFMKDHQDEMEKMKIVHGESFLILVCGKDGMVVLSYNELKKILDENHEATEWISASRTKGKMYTVKGKDGELDYKVGRSDFPQKIFDYFSNSSVISAADKFENNLGLHSFAKSVRGIFGQRKVSTANG